MKVQELRQVLSKADRSLLEKAFVESYKNFPKRQKEEIDQIIKDIEQSEGGDTIHVDMKKDTIVPKEVLESIQGKEVNIVLNMGGYSWSISGNEVVADGLKDIDLEVIVDTDGIPPGHYRFPCRREPYHPDYPST